MVIPNCIQPERLLPDEYTVEKVKKIKEQYSVNKNNIPKLIDIEVRNEVIFKQSFLSK